MIRVPAEAERNIRNAAAKNRGSVMMEEKLKGLSKEKLQEILLDMTDFLSEEQRLKLEELVEGYGEDRTETEKAKSKVRMSQETVTEKMEQIKSWMKQIDEGELYLDIDEYEDYSSGYWDSDWITDYYDNQEIGNKLEVMILFAKDCIDDLKYQDACFIYDWLWEMYVSTDSEYDAEPVDLEMLAEKDIIHTDMEQLALLTLYAAYQVTEADKRAEKIYAYFCYYTFRRLHIEDMFRMGRENLPGAGQFWQDWIALLKTKGGEAEGRFLKEALLYTEGIEGLVKAADENYRIHPSLYLTAMKAYNEEHDYERIEEIGKTALRKLDAWLIIRSKTALMAAYAASCLMHTDNVMRFCWEAFRSDSTDRNFLRLFGTKEMAEEYGMRGREVLCGREKENPAAGSSNAESCRNSIDDDSYYSLSFYTGDFNTARTASKNPNGSLGWSSRFIRKGIRLFLLYLYEEKLPSRAAASVADDIGFRDDTDSNCLMGFEREIIEESRRCKVSTFWNYFQRWKAYFPMTQEEKKKYLGWVERIVNSRADAIVGGQYRRHYGEVAVLLAMTAEIKESMGQTSARRQVFSEYKRKFPRHSSFQAEMKSYFNM